MFQYLLNSNYRFAYKFINQFGFLEIDFNFRVIGFDKIRNTIGKFQQQKNEKFFIQCFKVLQTQKQNPQGMIKVLMFINFLLQTGIQKSEQLRGILQKQLNIILQNSRNYCKNKQLKSQEKQSKIIMTQGNDKNISSAKSLTNINGYFSGAKGHQRTGSMASCVTTVKSIDSLSNAKNQFSEAGNTTKNYQISSSKQVLCQQFIQPYSIYLLKRAVLCNNNGQYYDDSAKLWSQINLFKLIFKISDGFSVLQRYYKKKYNQAIINYMQIIDGDVQSSYKRVTQTLKQKINKILISQPTIKNRLSVKQKNNPKLQIQLNQINQFLKQIGQINEKLAYMYCSKHTFDQLNKLMIKMPLLMKPQSKQYESIFKKIRDQDKQIERRSKSKNKQKSRSKPKVEKLIAFAKSEKYISIPNMNVNVKANNINTNTNSNNYKNSNNNNNGKGNNNASEQYGLEPGFCSPTIMLNGKNREDTKKYHHAVSSSPKKLH